MMTKYKFEPNYAVPPGITLKETLDDKGLSQADLALRTGLAEKTISQIVNGIAPISCATAEKLELVTSVPAGFWNRRELSYREALTRRAEVEKLQADIEWLKEIPVNVLIDRKFIGHTSDQADLVRRVLKFFGVGSVRVWKTARADPIVQFRDKRAQDRRPGYVATWLRMGELQAEAMECEPFDAREFKRALLRVRNSIAGPACEWTKVMKIDCAAAGVAVVFTKEIRGASVSGATRWLTKDKALMQLSLRYRRDDQLLFTFFHEAGHLLLHGKKQVFLEGAMTGQDKEEDEEADKFARDMLIPPEQAERLPYLEKNRLHIRRFAESINVPPGVIVARMQHDGLLHLSQCNDLKCRIEWAEK